VNFGGLFIIVNVQTLEIIYFCTDCFLLVA